MYLELFLIDDLLLNLLILRLAAAFVSVRPPLYRIALVSLASSGVSAAAAYLLPVLRSPFLRLPLLALMALGLPGRSLRAFLINAAAVLTATFTAGGCALAVAYLSGGGVKDGFISGGVSLRAFLSAALAVSFLPRAVRSILRRRVRNGNSAKVVLLHDGIPRRFDALIDTGNSLFEPVTGLPVAVIRCRALKPYARLPIPVATAAGRTVLFGFRPDRISVNGRETACIVAVTDEKTGAEAIVPPELVKDMID
ncbi:MAG: sigma-E processing peptidase SpoIIGA [Clostridia bacterium]|nr:sigma-E processing peptidase SpoIIGA [Clostridia bacterium]